MRLDDRSRQSVFCGAVACASELPTGGHGPGGPTAESQRAEQIDDVATFAAPSDARKLDVPPVDSIVGVLHYDGYEVVYDYGRQLARYDRRLVYTSRVRTLANRRAVEVSFREPGPMSSVRIVQIQDTDATLTIRVTCVSDGVCQLALNLFDSVRFVH